MVSDCYFLYICFSPQHWINISTSIVEWPKKRMHHAATRLSGPLFVIVGGEYQYPRHLNDMWLCDTTTKLWKKVLFLVKILCVCTNTPTTLLILFMQLILTWIIVLWYYTLEISHTALIIYLVYSVSVYSVYKVTCIQCLVTFMT